MLIRSFSLTALIKRSSRPQRSKSGCGHARAQAERAHVRVRCDDRIVNRHRGYLFEAELGFVGISPVRGAIAGGTEVYVVGQGFARAGAVTLGGQVMPEVRVSDSLLRRRDATGSKPWRRRPSPEHRPRAGARCGRVYLL